jgi:hypothetical protein|tara:strand:+ start:3226 stop:3588 length:363 start_codon:yes stop_codon:yes gene_type:complete
MSNYLYQAGIALAGENSVRTTHRNYIEFFDHIDPVPSWEQIQEKITELKALEPMRLLRIERNRRLAETDWVTIKAYSQSLVVSEEWKTYLQSLRDLPETQEPKLDDQGNLTNVDWPEVPE